MMRKQKLIIVLILLISQTTFGCVVFQALTPQSAQNEEAVPSSLTQTKPPPLPPVLTPTTIDMSKYYLSEEQQERLLLLTYTNGNCDLPCFWGIVPGETNWDFAQAFLNTLHQVHTDSTAYIDGSLPAYGLPLQFIDDKNRAIIFHITLTVGEERVQRINLYVETDAGDDLYLYGSYYSIDQILSLLGPPDDIRIDVFSNDIEYYPGYDLLLVYEDEKLAYWISGRRKDTNEICPLVEEGGQITYLRMSIANPDSQLDIFPPDWEFWALAKRDKLFSTEDLFGITLEEFYQSILYKGVNCFDVINSP